MEGSDDHAYRMFLQYRDRLDASRMTPIANARRDLFEAMKQIAETGHGPGEEGLELQRK